MTIDIDAPALKLVEFRCSIIGTLGAAFPTACGQSRQVRSYALVVTVVVFVRPEAVGVDPSSRSTFGILVVLAASSKEQ